MKLLLNFLSLGCALFLLSGCEKTIVIDHNEIGYLLDKGRLESIVIGRNELIYSTPLQQVSISINHYSFEVSHDNKVVLVCLSVDDPEGFYNNFNGRYFVFEEEISKSFSNNAKPLDEILADIHVQFDGQGVMIELCETNKSDADI